MTAILSCTNKEAMKKRFKHRTKLKQRAKGEMVSGRSFRILMVAEQIFI
ncbi:conserved hypothetical protein [delta proteobacterium NaphS2]|nr:conserved hypothetical protein [delta proteobacterium NaphS2]